MSYITETGKYNLPKIMKAAWNRYRAEEGFWSFSKCLKSIWSIARELKGAFDNRVKARDVAKTEEGQLLLAAQDLEMQVKYSSNSPISFQHQDLVKRAKKAREAYEAALVRKSQKEAA